MDILSYPRLLGGAEIGWTPQSERSWNEYKVRLGKHGPRMTRLGIKFYESPDIPWVYDSTLVNPYTSCLNSGCSKIYVNMKQSIILISSFDSKPVIVSMYDLRGRLIRGLKVYSQDVALDVKNITAGSYIITIKELFNTSSFKVMISK